MTSNRLFCLTFFNITGKTPTLSKQPSYLFYLGFRFKRPVETGSRVT